MQTPTFVRSKLAFAWAAVLLCAFYGVFAIAVGVGEGLDWIGNKDVGRAAPPLFVLHALTGGIVLLAGSLQLRLVSTLLRRRPQTHRIIGRTYVLAAWITSLASLVVVAGFDVSAVAKIAFVSESVLWFLATTVAFHKIRTQRAREHREWMIRSFSLAFFFVTGGFWLSVWENSALYPFGVLMSWVPNLMVAELWIRRTRTTSIASLPLAQRLMVKPREELGSQAL